MYEPTLRARLLAEFESLPRQIRLAAQWILDNPRDVALLSMREQAKLAGVTPATMTRLAQRMGYEGYEDLRAVHVELVRRGETEFSVKAEAMVVRRKREGDRALAFDMAETFGRHMQTLQSPEVLDAVTAAATVLSKAQRIFVLGFRSSYPVANHFAYVCSLGGKDVSMLDAPGGTGADILRRAQSGDVMVAVSVKPYTKGAVDLVDYGISRGLEIITVTDSHVSPLVRRASAAIVVPTASPSFFHSMTPAFAIGEVLASILAASGGERALKAVADMERQFQALSTHI